MDDEQNQPDDEAAAEDRTSFLGRVREAWRDTVGAYATDEGETRNLFHRLVDFGHLSADEAGKMLAEVKNRIESNRRELDHRVDESIRRATARLTIPSPEDLRRLDQQVGELEARLARLERG